MRNPAIKIIYSVNFLLLSIISLPPPIFTQEIWQISADHTIPGNPIYLSSFRGEKWAIEAFPGSDRFTDNFFPCMGISPSGENWVVWSAEKEEGKPRLYFSQRENGFWSDPRPVDRTNTEWESYPAITFDQTGIPWLAWSRAVGENIEILCSRWEGDHFGPAALISAPGSSLNVEPVLSADKNGDIVLLWQEWNGEYYQISQRIYHENDWSAEEIVFPQLETDQTLPSIILNSTGELESFWYQNGEITGSVREGTFWSEPRASRHAFKTTPSLPPPFAGEGWMVEEMSPGGFCSFRSSLLLGSGDGLAHGQGKDREVLSGNSFQFIGYGDSITYGTTPPGKNGCYIPLLENLLESAYPGDTFSIANQGYPGARTIQLLNGGGSWGCQGINATIDYYIEFLHQPISRILIMGGTNDMSDGDNFAYAKTNLGAMIDRARAKGLDPVLSTIIPRCDSSERSQRNTYLNGYFILPLAQEKNCPLSDPFTLFVLSGPWQNLLVEDCVHPVWTAGSQKIAEAWFEALVIYAPTPTVPASPTPTPAVQILDSGDYNGDSTSDIAVFRKSSGLWAVKGVTRVYFGTGSDIPASGDFDGDGTTDLALFRSASGLWAIRGITRAYFGGSSDIPAPGDYDGNGTCDAGIFRGSSGLWVVRGVTRVYFGSSSDLPVPVYGGLGESAKHLGIFRPASGLWAIRGVTRTYFGGSSDQPVPANYSDTPDSLDIGIFRASSGLWAVKGVTRVYFGSSQDRPVVGNYTGFIPADAGIFRPSSGLWAIRGLTRVYFGGSSDLPVSGLAINPSSTAVP